MPPTRTPPAFCPNNQHIHWTARKQRWHLLQQYCIRSDYTSKLTFPRKKRTLRNFPDTAAHQNKFYRECQPIKCERYPCTRSQHGSLCLTQGKKKDFYQRGNWFLLPWKLIITTVEIDKRKYVVSFDFITITTFNNKLILCSKVISIYLHLINPIIKLTDCWIFDLKVLQLCNSNLRTK